MLANWVKSEEPFLAYPPPDSNLVGWRDPFIFEFKGKDGKHKEWGMLMGSGIKGKGGCVMIYRSDNLRSGWRHDGMLCEADTVDTGTMWECPLLLSLTQVSEEQRRRSAPSGLQPIKAYNNISAFHPSSNGSHPASPTERKSPAVADAAAKAQLSSRRETAAVDGRPALDSVREDGKEPPPGGGAGADAAAGARMKSLLTEQLLNPYADAAEMDDRNVSM